LITEGDTKSGEKPVRSRVARSRAVIDHWRYSMVEVWGDEENKLRVDLQSIKHHTFGTSNIYPNTCI